MFGGGSTWSPGRSVRGHGDHNVMTITGICTHSYLQELYTMKSPSYSVYYSVPCATSKLVYKII